MHFLYCEYILSHSYLLHKCIKCWMSSVCVVRVQLKRLNMRGMFLVFVWIIAVVLCGLVDCCVSVSYTVWLRKTQKFTLSSHPQPCNCSGAGAITSQCDARTGHCVCKEGYEGNNCGKCKFGFFGYPLCTPCNCDKAGTNPHNCDSKGRCQCDDSGQCPCKVRIY